MQRILEALETEYGSTNTTTLHEDVLCHIDPLVTRARGALGLSWSNSASALVASKVVPTGVVSSLLVVTDERSFRSAVYGCVDGLRTKSQLELLKMEVQRLEPQRTSTFAWFRTGGAPPLLPSPPHVTSRLRAAIHTTLDAPTSDLWGAVPGSAATTLCGSERSCDPLPLRAFPLEGDKH